MGKLYPVLGEAGVPPGPPGTSPGSELVECSNSCWPRPRTGEDNTILRHSGGAGEKAQSHDEPLLLQASTVVQQRDLAWSLYY